MDLSSLNPEVLRELTKLAEQKLELTEKIKAIDARINAVANGTPVAKAASSKKGVAASGKKSVGAPKSGKRGQLKQQIIALLSKAGAEGIPVKEISQTLGVKNQNVHVWFSTTGKKVPGITKLFGARYALLPVSESIVEPEPSLVVNPESPIHL